MSLAGLQVLALESRRAAEIEVLIRKREGTPFVAPSLREAPIEANEEAFDFAKRLFAQEFDMMVLLTGVGTRYLHQLLATRYPPERFPAALREVTVVARGPKPAAVLRELQVPVTVMVPEPNTWRELVAATEGRPERRIAIQEYGRPNPALVSAFRERGAAVTNVRVYQWLLPLDLEPLREAVRRLANRVIDVALFTTAVQVHHLFQVAESMSLAGEVRDGLRRAAIASIGPTCTEALEEYGLRPDLEPSHPKMGFLVQETAARAAGILKEKR
ncbi:MAG: uroporphyrinogen-III synthase [Bryobacteraceae bacterium]